jgi:hypothetical protein
MKNRNHRQINIKILTDIAANNDRDWFLQQALYLMRSNMHSFIDAFIFLRY